MTRDLNGLRAALKQTLPHADIHVEGLGDGVVLLGNVSSPIESQQAFDIASRLVDDGSKVVNGITIHGRDQVMLKVTVAEVQRDVIKQLGIDLAAPVWACGSAVNFSTEQPVHRVRPGTRPTTSGRRVHQSASPEAISARRCTRWSAPASSARWPNRT